MSEPLIRLLAELPPAEPDPDRAERIKTECRAQLARQAAPAAAVCAPAPRHSTVQIWSPLIAVLGVAYLTEVIVQALRVYGSR
jgi:hypothetical protein